MGDDDENPGVGFEKLKKFWKIREETPKEDSDISRREFGKLLGLGSAAGAGALMFSDTAKAATSLGTDYLSLDDGSDLTLGNDDDFSLRYDSINSRLELVGSSNVWSVSSGGSFKVAGRDIEDGSSNTIWNNSQAYVPQGSYQGLDIDDSGTDVTDATGIDFSTNLNVTDDGDGSVTVDIASGVGTIDVQEGGSSIESSTETMDFVASDFSITNPTTGEAGVELNKNTSYTFPNSDGSNGQLLQTDGSGNISWVTYSSMASVSDSGSQILADPDDINFGSDLNVTDDGDGSLSVTLEGTLNPSAVVTPGNSTGASSAFPKIQTSSQYAIQSQLRFGAEGSTTTSTSYVTIADSDIAIDFDKLKDGDGNVYINVVYHLRGDASARVYRQNAGTAVTGTAVSGTASTTSWTFQESGWIDMSSESGFESYQIQIRSDDGNGVEYNSVIIQFASPQG